MNWINNSRKYKASNCPTVIYSSVSYSKPKDFYEVILCCSPQGGKRSSPAADWPERLTLRHRSWPCTSWDELDFKTQNRVSLKEASCPPHGKHVWCRDGERGNIKRRPHKWEDTSALVSVYLWCRKACPSEMIDGWASCMNLPFKPSLCKMQLELHCVWLGWQAIIFDNGGEIIFLNGAW